MNYQKHLETLNSIAAEASTKGKTAMLELALGASEDFKTIIEWMLNPNKSFGILDLIPTEGEPMPLGVFLTQLSTRHLTGDAARREAGKFPCPELILRILNKDPKAGFSDSLVNKACPGLIPEYPYMRCSLPKHVKFMKDWPWEKGVLAQLKADGRYANLSKDHQGNIQILSRQGFPMPLKEFGNLTKEVEQFLPNNIQIHGEFLVVKAGDILPRQIGNGILNSIVEGGSFAEDESVLFECWDILPNDKVVPKVKFKTPVIERFSALQAATKGLKSLVPIEHRIVYSKDEAMEYYREVLKRGLEGLILKLPNAIWFDGTSKEQIKLKLDVNVDLKIAGFTEGKGARASTFGAVVCRTSDDLLEVKVSGFKEDQLKKISAMRDQLLNAVMTVKANAFTTPSSEGKLHSLSLPRFVELRSRDDKSVADTLQQVIDQFESAING